MPNISLSTQDLIDAYMAAPSFAPFREHRPHLMLSALEDECPHRDEAEFLLHEGANTICALICLEPRPKQDLKLLKCYLLWMLCDIYDRLEGLGIKDE